MLKKIIWIEEERSEKEEGRYYNFISENACKCVRKKFMKVNIINLNIIIQIIKGTHDNKCIYIIQNTLLIADFLSKQFFIYYNMICIIYYNIIHN